MSTPTWKLNKAIPFSADYTAHFYTLYEDARDTMCDALRPEWVVSSREKNRLVTVTSRSSGYTVFRKEVSKDEGNAMYVEMKPLDRCGYGVYGCREWLRGQGVVEV